MRTLIIGDIHHNIRAVDKIIKYENADQVICVGDLFDDFNDTVEMVENSAKWLVDFVKRPNHIFIRGNHDVGYEFPYRVLKCSGYEEWKSYTINDIVSKSTWDKLQWYHNMDNKWLITHAGLHDRNLPLDIKKLHKRKVEFFDAICQYLDVEIASGLRRAANCETHWTLSAGYARGGNHPIGGMLWCDFNKEFYPIKGINQILGHTPQPNYAATWCKIGENDSVEMYPSYQWSPKSKDIKDGSVNLCLDVWKNMHYATWDGKNLTVGSHYDLEIIKSP